MVIDWQFHGDLRGLIRFNGIDLNGTVTMTNKGMNSYLAK